MHLWYQLRRLLMTLSINIKLSWLKEAISNANATFIQTDVYDRCREITNQQDYIIHHLGLTVSYPQACQSEWLKTDIEECYLSFTELSHISLEHLVPLKIFPGNTVLNIHTKPGMKAATRCMESHQLTWVLTSQSSRLLGQLYFLQM